LGPRLAGDGIPWEPEPGDALARKGASVFDRLLHRDAPAAEARLERLGKDRHDLADAIAAIVAEGEAHPLARGAYPLVRPRIARACTPTLLAIRRVLVDPSRFLDPACIERLGCLLRDGAMSPLFGGDAAAALLAVADVEREVAGAEASTSVEPRVLVLR
jgi:hypothetical protein